MIETTSYSDVDLNLADVYRLEEVIDRQAIGQVCKSIFDLFGISVRIFSKTGSMLADVHQERTICRYVNSLEHGRIACSTTVNNIKSLSPDENFIVHPCFTGAVYRAAPILYQGRTVGHLLIGPYLPAETTEVPQTLLDVDPQIDHEIARQRLAEMPRVKLETITRICNHVTTVISLLLFSNHKAQLASAMHVASVRESYRELTERTERLEEAHEKLKDLDRLKSNFLTTVSHELKTPLTSIIGYSEMLQNGFAGEMNEEQKEFTEIIRTKGEHLLALIRSMLDLGKLEQGSAKLQIEEILPHKLLESIVKSLKPQADKKKIEIIIEGETDVPPFMADPVSINQIMLNLCENALKFTPTGGFIYVGIREIEFDKEGDNQSGFVLMGLPQRAIEWTVRDTGAGMAESELTKIFDAFYQIDGSATREHGGAGIGLSIVKRLTDLHGGEVRVTSQPGQGTTFNVIIPDQSEEG